MGEVREACDEAGWSPGWGYRLLAAVVGALAGAPPGRFLLCHDPGADHACCFQALPQEDQSPQVPAPPSPTPASFPCGPAIVRAGVCTGVVPTQGRTLPASGYFALLPETDPLERGSVHPCNWCPLHRPGLTLLSKLALQSLIRRSDVLTTRQR